jgi:hypothetical protein
MKGWDDVPLGLVLVLAVIVCYGCICGYSEHFSRFEDTTNRKRTEKLVNSYFKQETNHVRPADKFNAPIHGVETPFRVNMFHAYL